MGNYGGEEGLYTVATRLKYDPTEDVIYASGTFNVSKSNDGGSTWEQVIFEEVPENIRVNDMVTKTEDGSEVLYLGTNRRGLFTYVPQDQ